MPHFIFIQQISVLNILNMPYNLHFLSSKCRLFHNATLFGFCITHILNTECAKIWKKKSVAKRLTNPLWIRRNVIYLFYNISWNIILFLGATDRRRTLWGFITTLLRITLRRIPVHQGSARRPDNTQRKRKTFMLPAGFKPVIQATERL